MQLDFRKTFMSVISRPKTLSLIALLILIALIVGLDGLYFIHYSNSVTGLLGIDSSLCFVVLLAALLISFFYLVVRNSYRSVGIFALIAILAVIYTAILMHRLFQDQTHQFMQKMIDQTAGLVQVELASQLDLHLMGFEQLSESWQTQAKHLAKIDQNYEVNLLKQTFSGVESLSWVTPSDQLHWPDEVLVGKEAHAITYLIIFIATLMSLVVLMATGFVVFVQRRANQLNQLNEALKQEMQERKKAEAAKLRMKEAFMQNQKLQAIGTLAGGIAHNFNNLLYSVKGYVQLTRSDLPKDSLGSRNLGKVLQALENAEALVSGILAFSREEKTDFEFINIESVLSRSLDLLRMTLPATIHLETHFAVQGVQVKGSAAQLQQVMMNIIKNAVDAMQGAGCVTIRATIEQTNERLLYECARLTYPQYVVIRIADKGVGMDKQTQQRIFEPFFTTKDVGKGTGLGLATSHSILLDHHGDLTVRSKLGEGSTLSLFIPIIGGPNK